ncbi:MAG: glycosyltransferase [Magnetococcales bacterium]|nr:glycosyltransferase [Magnetococcales bacterium]
MSIKRPLKVVQMLPALESGGVERGTLELGRHLVQSGHRSVVIASGGRMTQQLQDEGSLWLPWSVGRKDPSALYWLFRLRYWLQRERPDVLHLRSRVPAWIGWLAWRSLPKATRPLLVTTVHGFYSVNRGSAIMVAGERVVAVSTAIMDYILQSYPSVEPERIQLIHRGVDDALYSHGFQPDSKWLAQWNRDYPALKGRQVVTLPGRLTRLKGHATLLLILEYLRSLNEQGGDDSMQRVSGLIVGGEDPRHSAYLQEIRDRAEALGLVIGEDLIFTGHRTDLREIMAVSDVVLSLSEKPESFGRTVLEALKIGTPVVGYGRGGVGEMLHTLLPEGAVTPGDEVAIAQQTAAFLQKRPEVPEVPGFTLQAMVERTLEMYLEALHERDRMADD